MNSLKLKVLDKNGGTRMPSELGEKVSLVYTQAYEEGDWIALATSAPNCFCVIQFEDTLPPCLVYIKNTGCNYKIPFGEDRIVFSPKAFTGNRHVIRARMATKEEIASRRNLAFNCYDRHGDNGIFPHSSANIETRGEAVFASYNAIDGVYENFSHGEWPYQSWGINRDKNAELKLDFGRKVSIDEIRLTLRADFPHDSWWTNATMEFSDGSQEVFSLQKSGEPQSFSITPRKIEWLVLKNLIKNEDDPSPFPALTQLEAIGTEA